MKVFILAFITQIFFLTAFAATYETQIHSIEKGQAGEPHLILLTNGHVGFLEGNGKQLLEQLQESLEREDWVEVKLDENLNVIAVMTVSPPPMEGFREQAVPQEEIKLYEPTVLRSPASASSIFRNMRRGWQYESQCYNRAHIWNYEEYQRTKTKSNKLFLFFTSKYIRAYRYKWWFHVAPMVLVGGSRTSNWRVLDRRYAGGPLGSRSWTNIFMSNNAQCKVVYKYSDYRKHQSRQWCYLIPTSMYYWQPRDIENYENSGYQKTSFINWEINHAYWEAF